MRRAELSASEHFCPNDVQGHTFNDCTYWGYSHPKCHCGYQDKSRILVVAGEEIRKGDPVVVKRGMAYKGVL